MIQNGIPHQVINNNSITENITININNNIYIIAAYNRPTRNFTPTDIRQLMRVSKKVLLVGDLNARHTSWNCSRNNPNGRTIQHVASADKLNISYPEEHTHFPMNGCSPSTIDIILNKNVTNLTGIRSLHELNSDHNPISFELTAIGTNSKIATISSFKHTNWNEFRKSLDKHITINRKIENEDSIEQEIKHLTEAIHKAKRSNSQKIKISTKEPLPEEILTLIRLRNKNRKSWQRSGQANKKQEMKNLNKK